METTLIKSMLFNVQSNDRKVGTEKGTFYD